MNSRHITDIPTTTMFPTKSLLFTVCHHTLTPFGYISSRSIPSGLTKESFSIEPIFITKIGLRYQQAILPLITSGLSDGFSWNLVRNVVSLEIFIQSPLLVLYYLYYGHFRSTVGARFSLPVQTGSETNPASCTMGTGSFPGGKMAGAWC